MGNLFQHLRADRPDCCAPSVTSPGAADDRAAIEFFNGGHTINGRGTFDFLHTHLEWPGPEGGR